MRVFAKRLLFIARATLIFVVFFPMAAGLPAMLSIVGIPIVYLFLAIPAALTGLTLALLMLTFKNTFKPGKLVTLGLGSLVGSLYLFAILVVFQLHRAAYGMLSPPHNNDPGTAIQHTMVGLMIIPFIVCFVLAGGACSALITGKRVEYLLSDVA
jgi:hypothetical protein